MQTARAGLKIYIAPFGITGPAAGTVPDAGAAINAFFAIEGGQSVFTGMDSLAGAGFDANPFGAALANAFIGKTNMVGAAA